MFGMTLLTFQLSTGLLLLAYKCAGDGLVHIINLTAFLQHQHKLASLVCSLQWTQTDTQYINLGTANGSYS